MEATKPEAAFDIFQLYKIFLSSKFINAAASWKYLFSNTYLHIYPAKGNVRTQKEMANHPSLNSLPVCCRHEEVDSGFAIDCVDLYQKNGIYPEESRLH